MPARKSSPRLLAPDAPIFRVMAVQPLQLSSMPRVEWQWMLQETWSSRIRAINGFGNSRLAATLIQWLAAAQATMSRGLLLPSWAQAAESLWILQEICTSPILTITESARSLPAIRQRTMEPLPPSPVQGSQDSSGMESQVGLRN